MKITLAQLNYHIGNFAANEKKIIDAIQRAQAEGSDLVLFGELSVCGYPPRDFLEFTDFIDKCYEVVEHVKPYTKDIAVLLGAPYRNPRVEGKDLYNSAFFIYQEKVIHVTHKTLLPTYDVFDEYRYFEPNTDFECVEYKGKKIAITICEDIWNVGNENPLYKVCPMDQLIHQKPDVILNLSASPFSYDHAEQRILTCKSNVALYGVPLFYCNHVGAQTELIFDGGSLVVNQDGVVYDEMPYFVECMRTYDLDAVIENKKTDVNTGEEIKEKAALIHDALVCGIREYFQKSGLQKATLGLSGGIDSVLTCVLAVEALGAENVHPILMPSQYSSDHSVSDSEQLCKNLGVQYDIIPIKTIFETYRNILDPFFAGYPENVTEENLQARIRANLLMAFSNKMGFILLNTTNKSEAAVGYGTLYGDMCGGLGVLGDVYKTAVYEVANHINRNQEIIPRNCITKAPSAELKPGQKDSDSLPDYAVLDKLLYQYIEKRQGPKELVALGFDAALVTRVLKLVNSAEHKRHQTPPILRISNKAFGSGRRMPIVGKYLI